MSDARANHAGVGSLRYKLAWLAIWGGSFMGTFWLADTYCCDETNDEGFAAMMGIGMPWYAIIGYLASWFVAKVTRRNWTFLAGAAVFGLGIAPLILAPDWGIPSVVTELAVYLVLGLALGGAGLMLWTRRVRRTKT